LNTIQLRILIQHVINQLTGTWSLPNESFPCPDQLTSELGSTCQRYLSMMDRSRSRSRFLRELNGHALAATTDKTIRQIGATGLHALYCTDPDYPPLLRHIHRFPLMLFCRGSRNFARKPLVAIVGARKASAEALNASHNLARRLADRGYSIVSGGAFGCDAAAHQGAIASGLPNSTIAVFASGVENLYPRRLLHLYEKILDAGGSLISERLPDARPQRHDFPIRNRIIAGLVDELHVMQASETSGAMITASMALDFGREVRTWNPFLNDIRFVGNARLISVGAENSQTSQKLV
jgi:DNA processing protein